ncbi:MAG: hypothetical protein KME27_00695 [Lyngbya sp. HA4199-MV5]|jgi:hypothetical protein|nr:hypothetical protein [Lyngbya sp. HA4199-MV5]
MATNPRDRALKRPQTSTNLPQKPPVTAASKLVPHLANRSVKHGWNFRLPRLSTWSAIVTILLAVGGLGAAGWLGVRLMVNPQTLLWVNRFLPDWIPIPITGLKPPQTLAAIQTELTQAGRISGALVPLGTNTSFLDHKTIVSDVLLPVLSRRPNCQSDCEKVVELRVYQTLPASQREQRYQLLDQLTIVGPDESFVLAPLINAGDTHQGSTRSLPLMTLERFKGKVPTQGVWLNLSGRWLRGDSTIAYGQVLHYNPSRVHLHLMTEWTSPAGEEPIWANVTGASVPNLVINQTVGMEPQFQLFQVKPRNFLASPLKVEPLSLLEPAIDNGTYANGLLLARNGLWSTGLQWLQSIKRHDRTGQWSATAQAQLALIALHAQATRTQANKSWASPSQQVLANLIDGRWRRALSVFTANAENSAETTALLKADSGRLQSRIEAALRVSPQQRDVRRWGALLIAARQGSKAAIVWLKKQPGSTSTDLAQANALIARLEAPTVESPSFDTLAPGQLVGVADVLPSINASAWLKPKRYPALKLDQSQAWYRVQIAGYQDGKRWRFANTSLGLSAKASADRLWNQLGLAMDSPLSIVLWLPNGEQQTVSASIKAVRLKGDGLELLAAGDASPPGSTKPGTPRPLAYTETALQWQDPQTVPLSDWVQQQPAWATSALPLLVKELTRSGNLPTGIAITWEALEALGLGSNPVQLAALTSSNPSDVIVTIDPETLDGQTTQTTKRTTRRSRTLVFSATGKLLYSECSTDAALTYLAIADLGQDGGRAIVASGSENYRLLRWSAKRKRFE